MKKWKKSFRSIPQRLLKKVALLDEEQVQVAAVKTISTEDIFEGTYEHLQLTSNNSEVGAKWEVSPAQKTGRTSKRNTDGWEDIRKDLPKYTKNFYQDIPIYGDASRNGWTTVGIPREVYHRQYYPPYNFIISVEVLKTNVDGTKNILFLITEPLSKDEPDFEKALLFGLNLLQENTGVSGVIGAKSNELYTSHTVDWSFFPPGEHLELADEISRVTDSKRAIDKDELIERLKLFDDFRPTRYLRGLGGNNCYFGAQFADDLVVFENSEYGNAMYVLYGQWEDLSKQSRRELLKLDGNQFDRIIHTKGWQGRFAKLMQDQLQARGLRIRIGARNRRTR